MVRSEHEIRERLENVQLAIKHWSAIPGTRGTIRNLKGQEDALLWALGEITDDEVTDEEKEALMS